MAYADPTPNHLVQLEARTRALAFRLVRDARAAGIPLIITSSRRSYFEQLRHVVAGRSQTLASRHLSGRAFDVDVAGWSRSALPKSFLEALGAYGEHLGLTWGGRWRSLYDPGHFEAP